jgi:UDPglucose 6-dehydrogenase
MNIAVLGLGKLGSALAAVLAENHFQVHGADIDEVVVEALNCGRPLTSEPGLEGMLRRNRKRLHVTADASAAVRASEVTFIAVPTPSEDSGGFSLSHVLECIERAGEALRETEGFHTVVVTSTVTPGSMEGTVRPLLEAVSGKRCGRELGLCYNPEFIALGSIIHDLRNPDIVAIGESDARAGQVVEDIHRGVCENQPLFVRMNFINAELVKLCVNTFVTMKISYANALAEICERLEGADVDKVTAAMGADKRIGHKYLKGGLGYGGPCFPRDNLAFAAMARELGIAAELNQASDNLNRRQVDRLSGLIESLCKPGQTVGVLGLSYKPLTNVVEESQALMLVQRLAGNGIRVVAYDPAATELASRVLPPAVVFADSMEACASVADVLVVATPWEEFRSLKPGHLKQPSSRRVVVDCWRILPAEEFGSTAVLVRLGVGSGVQDSTGWSTAAADSSRR